MRNGQFFDAFNRSPWLEFGEWVDRQTNGWKDPICDQSRGLYHDTDIYPAMQVEVDYGHPSLETLKREFDDPDELFDAPAGFVNPMCRDVDRQKAWIPFRYFRHPRPADKKGSADHLLRLMGRMHYSAGVRPALFEEMICFSQRWCHTSTSFPIFTIGSLWDSKSRPGRVFMPCIWSNEVYEGHVPSMRYLDLLDMENNWYYQRSAFVPVRSRIKKGYLGPTYEIIPDDTDPWQVFLTVDLKTASR